MKLCSTGEMEDVAVDMANHFMDGTGSDYSNAVLTKNIALHENTEVYVHSVANIINGYIQRNNGDISGLKYNVKERDKSIMVNYMKFIVYSPNIQNH